MRTYDSNAGTWTTPDAYAGDVDDPASQKAYMWNGNDPEAYSDPIGFVVGYTGNQQQQSEEQKSYGQEIDWLLFIGDFQDAQTLQWIQSDPSFIVNFSAASSFWGDSFGPDEGQRQPGESYSAAPAANARVIGTVHWMPRDASRYQDTLWGSMNGRMSPAMTLLHELSHAADFEKGYYSSDRRTWEAEERRVMDGSEARALEDEGRGPRWSHRAAYCSVSTMFGECP